MQTHRSDLGTPLRHPRVIVPSSSMRRRIPARLASLVACTSRRPPTNTRIYENLRLSHEYIGSEIHIPRSCRHNRTLSDEVHECTIQISELKWNYLLWRAELGDGTVQHVQVVEEVNDCVDFMDYIIDEYKRCTTHHGLLATHSDPRRLEVEPPTLDSLIPSDTIALEP